MATIQHKQIRLLDVPLGSYLAHSCNTQGVWKAGISADIKDRFPHAFAVYNRACQGNSKFALGKSWSIWDGNYRIVCLMTSEGYGKDRSSKEDVLKYTEMALHSLLSYVTEWEKDIKVIYSNRFNTIFNVPWVETEIVLKKVLDSYKVDWIVCSFK